jgi:hypothetical protein
MADIRNSIQIAGKPDVIYPLVATGEGFGHWWAEDVTESDGAVALGFFKRATIYRLRLKGAEAPLFADWVCETGDEWADTHLTFQLEARGPNTLVRFTHGGWPAESDYFVACTTTWGELMFRLKAAAEGKPRGPLFLAGEMAY